MVDVLFQFVSNYLSLIIMDEIEIKAMPTLKHCNTSRTYLHINVCRQSKNPQFEILYSIVAPSGGAEKNLNMSAQLQTVLYIKPTKLQGLLAFWLSQMVTLFGITYTNLTSCNE